jgi:hypothetical protein
MLITGRGSGIGKDGLGSAESDKRSAFRMQLHQAKSVKILRQTGLRQTG